MVKDKVNAFKKDNELLICAHKFIMYQNKFNVFRFVTLNYSQVYLLKNNFSFS